MSEAVDGVFRRDLIEHRLHRPPQRLARPTAQRPQALLHLREHHLNRVVVWAVRRQEQQFGPGPFDQSTRACSLVAGEFSITTTSPGRSSCTSTCATNDSKMSPLTAPSTTVLHRMPAIPNAAISVVVCQCPCGALAISRWPIDDRPRRRVMLVLAHVSSMKINRLASSVGRSSSHCSRRSATSGRSCSAAWSVFF